MATTINEGFRQLRTNLEITTLQESSVSTTQNNVRSVVEKGMDVIDSFLTGSYRRNTLIKPLKEADIDIFIVLDPKYFTQYLPSSLLDKVKTVLKETYTNTPKISRNGQAVTITFTEFQVDVVPSFNRQGGGYLIPDSNKQRWISTDPKSHVKIWSEANKGHNNNLVPLMKMIKAWNKKKGNPMRSFHLEALVLSVFKNSTISSFPSAVHFFFDKSKSLIYNSLSDPSGLGGDLSDYLSYTDRITISGFMNSACQYANAAILYDQLGLIEQSFGEWKKIFGDYFPAYG